MPLKIGAIADDYTGATDLAVTLVNQGMRVAQLFGVPQTDMDLSATDAVVVALKSRTIDPDEAVSQSLAALAWLQRHDAQQVFFKYCSTFDSTDQGNIGPVADALTRALSSDIAVLCPAFPTNKRSIYMGHLFVHDQLLANSPMKDHPLTPMRNSNLVQLMDAQSTFTSGLIPHPVVRQGADAIRAHARQLAADGHRYAVPDAIDEDDLRAIGEAAEGQRLITGGSGVALGLPANFDITPPQGGAPMPQGITGRALVLAGSCSKATREQIARAKAIWPHHKIDVDALAAGQDLVQDLADWAIAQPADTPVLIYASADPDEVAANQQAHGVAEAGEMVEATLASLAQRLTGAGFNRLVVAGGETSGAVVSALGISAIRICGEIDPGVPWTQTMSGDALALALKSGNFGGPDFFAKAFEVLG